VTRNCSDAAASGAWLSLVAVAVEQLLLLPLMMMMQLQAT
jgi:hypothetical protein